ncbi:MAG: glycosyltransferase family 4 protein, partial [Desulfamplus sp.]|nr:glycosyltransferase family 4 protein [Desulfamplus sp.]
MITNSTCWQDLIGGASRNVDEICKFLSKKNKVVLLVPNRLNKNNYEKINENYEIYRYPYKKNVFCYFYNAVHAFKSVNELTLKYKGFDVIWGHSPEPWIFIDKRNIKQKKYSVHGPWILESQLDHGKNLFKNFFIKIGYLLILKKNVSFHFQSNYVYFFCKSESRLFGKINKTIVPIILDENNISIVKNSKLSMILDETKINLLLARRLVNRTGVLQFIQVINMMPKTLKRNINLIIVGDGYLKNRLLSELQNIDVKAYYLGNIQQLDIDFLYSMCDATCMPSLDAEGFGVPIFESLLRGTPVIYSKVGGMAEY